MAHWKFHATSIHRCHKCTQACPQPCVHAIIMQALFPGRAQAPAGMQQQHHRPQAGVTEVGLYAEVKQAAQALSKAQGGGGRGRGCAGAAGSSRPVFQVQVRVCR